MTHLGDRIQELMDGKGWEQADLARESEVPRSTVSRVITGKVKEPDLAVLETLATALEATFEEFVALVLLDATGRRRTVTFPDDASELVELSRAYPWLKPLAKDLAEMSPKKRQAILDYLAFQKGQTE